MRWFLAVEQFFFSYVNLNSWLNVVIQWVPGSVQTYSAVLPHAAPFSCPVVIHAEAPWGLKRSRVEHSCGADVERCLEEAALLCWCLCGLSETLVSDRRGKGNDLRVRQSICKIPFNRTLHSACVHYVWKRSPKMQLALTNRCEQSKEGSWEGKACGLFSCQALT